MRRFAGSRTMPAGASSPSSPRSRAAVRASRTTLPGSGSTPRRTPASLAASSRASRVRRRSVQASLARFPGWARHMSSGSRVPEHRVTTSAPSSGTRPISRAACAVWAARRSGSGWMTLKVAETLGMATPARVERAPDGGDLRPSDVAGQRRAADRGEVPVPERRSRPGRPRPRPPRGSREGRCGRRCPAAPPARRCHGARRRSQPHLGPALDRGRGRLDEPDGRPARRARPGTGAATGADGPGERLDLALGRRRRR